MVRAAGFVTRHLNATAVGLRLLTVRQGFCGRVRVRGRFKPTGSRGGLTSLSGRQTVRAVVISGVTATRPNRPGNVPGRAESDARHRHLDGNLVGPMNRHAL